ncbi:nucleoside/nucleotide kinase family protein [Lichenibacterium ramalinae]|uniref:Nucleoside/nucleotide kinase family protein n=1 Tax=Lichenibacterium ramalinae TaxID=2316527 RepID=A0A4Q2RAQ9_9HYPH|nr:nucleoside/nucleotide kinase family protein [Lichenibacterium ramalinae]RYB02680.1 nucleoside/nucleotide kinase family protein [Lichenibacterium ramalinae]
MGQNTGTRIDFEHLVAAVAGRRGDGRLFVAIAGPPGGGKSTVAEALVARLEAADPGRSAVLPMDGYHYDDRVLLARGLHGRKGAPDTFDVAGLRHMLGRLRRDDEEEVAVPVFDRDIEIARAGARVVPRGVRTLVVEGNYLLLGQAPWSSLRPAFDLTVLVAVPEEELRRRLTARWQGYRLSPEAVAAKLDGNDLPNGRLVMADSVAPDLLLAL